MIRFRNELEAERDRAIAERDEARAALARIEALHQPFAIYGECDCDNSLHEGEEPPAGHIDVEDIGRSSRRLYDICCECCASDSTYQTEECATWHVHSAGGPLCPTIAALRGDA